MAFKSIGQKYGFVSAGDVFRQEIADAQAMAENAKAELAQSRDDTELFCVKWVCPMRKLLRCKPN